MDGMSPPLNRTGFRRDTTTTAHRPGSRQSNGSSVLSQPRVANYPERGARLARREERAYREYVSDEQRSQAGCPARRTVKYWLGQDTSFACTARIAVATVLHRRNLP